MNLRQFNSEIQDQIEEVRAQDLLDLEDILVVVQVPGQKSDYDIASFEIVDDALVINVEPEMY